MQIGIFSGSFDPIHVGHTIVADYICQNYNLNEIWFSVSPQNPLKDADKISPLTNRVEMLCEAISSDSRFKYTDIETTLPTPSYTIDTLTKLSQQYPQHTFTLLIGSDNWVSFKKWRNYNKILDNYNIIIYPRIGYNIDTTTTLPPTVKVSNAPQIEVSSTYIRNEVKKGKPMNYYIHPNVDRYIKTHNLYR